MSNNQEVESTNTATPQEYKDISHDQQVEEVQDSLCMNCGYEEGITRIMLTKIPFFKEVILFAFHCPECGYKSNEVRPAGSICEKGVHFELTVKTQKDLDRQIVKMDSATLTIPVLDFEIPPSTQKGSLNTIEGFLKQSISGITHTAQSIKETQPEDALKLFEFISKLNNLLELETPFTLILDDPSGNSYIENPLAPKPDPDLIKTTYNRTEQQDIILGLNPIPRDDMPDIPENITEKKIVELPNRCYNCGTLGVINMVLTDIPHFKSVVLMAFSCDECGYKTNEIKPGGEISPKGTTLTLHCDSIEDLSRDVLKSATANAIIPEIDLEITHGSLGGRFTTVEGLLTLILDEIEKNPFFRGDSADPKTREKYEEVTSTMKQFIANEKPFTLIIDDPISNSYIQNIYAPDPDPNLTVVEYERTYEQNDELGLNDMNTENYLNQNDDDKEEECCNEEEGDNKCCQDKKECCEGEKADQQCCQDKKECCQKECEKPEEKDL
eukprot:gene4655-5817_t